MVNTYYRNCPRCKKLRPSTKSLTLSRMPVVLLIHLKRFSFEGPFRNKLETIVDCPTRNLDISNYVPNSMIPPNTERPAFKYDLYGVSVSIQHDGGDNKIGRKFFR